MVYIYFLIFSFKSNKINNCKYLCNFFCPFYTKKTKVQSNSFLCFYCFLPLINHYELVIGLIRFSLLAISKKNHFLAIFQIKFLNHASHLE